MRQRFGGWVKRPPVRRTTCRWSAKCENAAVTTQHHSVLGKVPICRRCLEKFVGGKLEATVRTLDSEAKRRLREFLE